MWVAALSLILGFSLLVWSADKFLSGAASTARNLGVSKMIIGLTGVSIGTSSPEIFLALTLLLALFAYGINSRTVITRFEGGVLLLAWIGYNALLIEQAVR